jgi:hypothetical protein
MSFGFSISDILLTYKALERLMKTRNSCQEYQELSVFLHRCRNDIERYEALLPHIFSDPHPDIVGEINDFKELLDKHQESFRKYEKHLSRNGSGNALRKIQWGLRLSPKIKALKDDLDARIGRVNQRIETHRIAYQMVALQRVTRDLGNPWEGDLDRNNTPVALRNPFDHASLFPFLELSQSREVCSCPIYDCSY